MFIEIDVSAGDNCQESLMLMFNGLSEPAPAASVWTTDPGGADMMCAVTGWSTEGACPAYSAMVEESGEGSAVLIYGGDEGIRLKPWTAPRSGTLGAPTSGASRASCCPKTPKLDSSEGRR